MWLVDIIARVQVARASGSLTSDITPLHACQSSLGMRQEKHVAVQEWNTQQRIGSNSHTQAGIVTCAGHWL